MEFYSFSTASFFNREYSFKVSLDSHMYMNNVTWRDSFFTFMNVLSSTAEIYSVNIRNVNSYFSIMKLEQVINMTIEGAEIRNLTSLHPFYIADSYIHSIKSVNFEIASERHIWMMNSEIGLIKDSSFSRCIKSTSILLTNSNLKVDNCSFTENRNVFPWSSDTTIEARNCKFSYLTA